MHDLLFEQQRQLGLKPWSDLAQQAGVPDLAVFESCTQRSEPAQRIVEGKQLAEKMGVPGTPTLLVSGWLLPRPPGPEELDRMLKLCSTERSPVP